MDKVRLINKALGHLGERKIQNPDAPETNAGKHMAAIYDESRREVGRRFPWNFNETWAYIDKTTAPPFGYSDAYALPEDFLRLLIVGDPRDDIKDYRLLNQGAPEYRRVVALNAGGADQIPFCYNADVPLLHLWDPLALKVLSLWMALDLAKSTTGQDGQVEMLNKLLSDELKDAYGVDGSEQSIRLYQFSEVEEERGLANYGYGFTNVKFN
ncbi:MAG: hypothetical protein JST01_14500 [Cyanobacteria bacterium SZAS TMP-1]|nr:hypothetical protein [Cyanobacteria bacterium SZAS TMP-1]